MEILSTILPVFGIIGLGAFLAKIGFLTPDLSNGLNRLVYFVALPALLLRACAHAGVPSFSDSGTLIAVLLPSIGGGVVALVIARLLELKGEVYRAFVVTSFFGNLTYIGLPVIAHSLGIVEAIVRPEFMSTAVVVLILMNILFNVCTIGIFQPGGASLVAVSKRILLNPILLAGCAGVALATFRVPLPSAFESALVTLGGLAIPGALLCIGSSLLRAKLSSQMVPVVVASGIKVVVVPLLCWMLLKGLDLAPASERVAMIFCACPAAVASYSLAREAGCAPDFVATTITFSTLLSFVTLWMALALT